MLNVTHDLRVSRFNLSTRYGTKGVCSCGEWRYQTNETPSQGGNAEVKRAHKLHLGESA